MKQVFGGGRKAHSGLAIMTSEELETGREYRDRGQEPAVFFVVPRACSNYTHFSNTTELLSLCSKGTNLSYNICEWKCQASNQFAGDKNSRALVSTLSHAITNWRKHTYSARPLVITTSQELETGLEYQNRGSEHAAFFCGTMCLFLSLIHI